MLVNLHFDEGASLGELYYFDAKGLRRGTGISSSLPGVVDFLLDSFHAGGRSWFSVIWLGRAVQIEDLSWDGDVPCHELSSRKGSEHVRRDIRIALERIRRDMDHARRDLASASKTWVDSTSKFVQDKAPKVSATIDETLEKTSETFKRTMN